MYLALEDKGVFRSTDAGKQWVPLNSGLEKKRIYAVDVIGNRVFAGTNDGLYRLNADVWQQSMGDALKAAQSVENEMFTDTNIGFYVRDSGVWKQRRTENLNVVHSLTTAKNNLYVAVGPDFFKQESSASRKERLWIGSNLRQGWVFRSTDFGESWTEITPKNNLPLFSEWIRVKLFAAGNTLFAQGAEVFRSADAGETWTNLGTVDMNLSRYRTFQSVTVSKRTFYTVGTHGVYRTTDAGDSWHPFADGIVGTGVSCLIAYNNRLYGHTGRGIVQSTDGGESWNSVRIDSGKLALMPAEKESGQVHFSFDARLIVVDGAVYGISPGRDNLRIFRLSSDGNALIPVQGVPTLDGSPISSELMAAIAKAERLHLSGDREEDEGLTQLLHTVAVHVKAGGFAVSDGTFYVEYQRRLFKWKRGDPHWTNTGLIDLGERLTHSRNAFKLAASGETVYVGKRDGQLFQSLDGGSSWRDITSSLPLRFAHFNEIVFVGSTVYVSTDTGVLASQTGEHWRVLTDSMGKPTLIDEFAVHNATIYGAGDTGTYRLDPQGCWEQITPNIPNKVVSLGINSNRLYIATQQRGIFYISLPEDTYNTASYR